MSAPKPLRQAMPIVSSWIDELREAFGTDAINPAIRNGVAGGTHFYAAEGGQAIGNAEAPRRHVVRLDSIVLAKPEGGDL